MKEKKLPPQLFKTKRMTVRQLEMSDFKTWVYAYDNLLKKKNDFDEPFILKEDCDLDNFKKLVKTFKKSANQGLIFQLFAFDKKEGHIIGSVQCSLIQRYQTQKAYLGYSILNNYWRRGYGFELADGMINHAFKKLKLHRLEAEILPTNKASIKLSKKLGMTYEVLRRNCLYIHGEWRDHKAFVITAEDRGIMNMKPNKSLL